MKLLTPPSNRRNIDTVEILKFFQEQKKKKFEDTDSSGRTVGRGITLRLKWWLIKPHFRAFGELPYLFLF